MALSPEPHCDRGPENCFGCKARYWRRHGGITVAYSQGQDFFHDSTVESFIREEREGAAATGQDIEPVGQKATPSLSALGGNF